MAGAPGQDDPELVYVRGVHGERHPLRRRRPAPSGRTTYQGEWGQLVMSALIGVVGVVAGIWALLLGETQGLFLLGVGCVGGFVSVWTPHRVTLDDTGVVLRAVARRVRIPWDELESVAPPWWDYRHDSLRWGRSRGLAVLTLQAFPELHRMLVEIERRSLRTNVES